MAFSEYLNFKNLSQNQRTHCKCFDHKNYGDWKLRGPCRENLHYLWKRAVRIAGKPRDNYRSCNYHGVSPQFLQPFSIDSADFTCRDPAISSPRSFYGQNICSVWVPEGLENTPFQVRFLEELKTPKFPFEIN